MNSKHYILITGSTGFICRYLIDKLLACTDYNIVVTFRKDKGNFISNNRLIFARANLLDSDNFYDIFETFKPEHVVHLAAMARVSDGELNSATAIKTNLIATAAIVKLVVKFKAKSLIFASSNLAQNAVSVVGISKFLSEQYLQKVNSQATKLVTLRVPNVIDSKGAVTLVFKKLIAENKSITITHPDMSRLFVSGKKAADMLFYLMNFGEDKAVYVSCDKPVKIIDLARDMIKHSGKDLGIKIVGMRPGEKLAEKGFTLDEVEKTAFAGLGMLRDYCFAGHAVTETVDKLISKLRISPEDEIYSFLSQLSQS